GGAHGRAHDSRIDDPAGHGREVVGGDVDQLGADGQRDRAGEDVVVGGDAALGVVGAGGGADDLDHEDGPAHGGDGVRALDLDLLARPHLVLGDRNGDLAGVEIDRGAARDFGDRQGRALADGDDGLAAQEEAGKGAIAGDDAVVDEDVVLELQRDGLRGRRAGRGDVAFEGGDDTGL